MGSEAAYLFMALNISMVTRMDKDMVEAFLANSPVNMRQPISGKLLAHVL